MTFLKAFCIAFSIYSKIPVPQFKWEKKDMQYHLIFFPLVGALIGGLLVIWNYVCGYYGIGVLTYVLIGTAIPLIITGGFHVDGFMDTMDALKSYKTKEEKLEILKDPHIGAFSVIMLAAWGLVFMGSYSYLAEKEFFNGEYLGIFACAFCLSRILSALSVVSFKGAKKNGMLQTFKNGAGEKTGIIRIVLIMELAACVTFMLLDSLKLGLWVLTLALLYMLYYWKKTKKEFGGITGDTSGFFVVTLEVILTAAIAVYGVIL